MIKTLTTVAIAAALLAACGQKADNAAVEGERTDGPAMSTSAEPRNEAVDTTPTTGDVGTTPGASSFTEGQAKGAIESAGYTGVSELTQNENGIWQGKAMKDGAEVSVSVDYKGSVKTL
jgi:hypothetical protein